MYLIVNKICIKNYLINWKLLNLDNIEMYKPFFVLTNLVRINGKFRWLFRDIISEPLFLIFSFLTLKNIIINFEWNSLKIKLKNINIKWFLILSKKLKFNYLKCISKKKNLNIWTTSSCINYFDVIGQAIFIILNEIYKNKIKYFSNLSYGFDSTKSLSFLLKKIKTKWLFINGLILLKIKKSFNFINQNTLFNQLKKNIQDQNLFMLILKFFKYSNWIKNKILNIFEKKYTPVKYDHVHSFFFNIYLISFDYLLNNLIIKWNKKLITNIITNKKSFVKKTNVWFLKNWQENKKFWILKNSSRINLKYIRYINNLLIGLLSKKKLIFKLKTQLSIWIKSQLHLEFIEKKISFIKINVNTIKFLSFKIYYNKIKYFKISEKQLKISNRLKIKKKLAKNKIIKNIINLLWYNYKKTPIKLLILIKNMYQLKNKNFEFNFLNLLKRKYHSQYCALKLIEVQKKILNTNFKNNVLYKKWNEIEKIFFVLKSIKKNVKKETKQIFFFKKFIIKRILKEYGVVLNILLYDFNYLYNKIRFSKYKIKWPIKITKPLNVPDKVLYNANKWYYVDKKFIIILNYLQKVQFKVSYENNTIILSNISIQKIKQQFSNQVKKIKFLFIYANINILYTKLKSFSTFKYNKVKIPLQSSFIIIFYFKTILIDLLNLYQFCNNFSFVKIIVNYYIKRFLLWILKQKIINLKSNTLKFKNNISVTNYLLQKNIILIYFFSIFEINFWKILNCKNINKIILTQKFKNLQRMYLSN